MTDLELVGSTPLPSFVSIGDDAVYREITSSSNGYDVEGRIIRLYKRGLVPWRAAIAMVVFASLAAVAVLILKCVAAFRRKRGETAKRRNLSEKGEDTSDSEGGVECAVGEGSEGLSLPQQWASAEGHQEAVGLPPAKRQRLDSNSADGAAGETSRTQSEAAAAAGLLMLSQQQAVPSPSSETHVPLSEQSAEGVPRLLPAFLLLPQPHFIALGHGGSPGHPLPSTSAGAVGGPFGGVAPAPSPPPQPHQQENVESSVEAGPSHGVASAPSSPPQPQQQKGFESSAEERPGDSQQQPQQSLFPSAVEAEESSAPSAPPVSPSSHEPSTSSGLLPQRHDSPAAGRLHAFARLPRLDDPDHQEQFNPIPWLMAPFRSFEVYRTLQNTRELLAKDSLSPEEFSQLVRVAEMLAGYTLNYETSGFQALSMTRIIKLLGRRFLVLDAVISTFKLLGTNPAGEWWQQLIRVVPHVVPLRGPFRQHTGREQHAFRKNMAERLSNAIAIMKTGNRPSTRQLVELKRFLFCSPLSPDTFKTRQWDTWREDDEEAKRNGYTDA